MQCRRRFCALRSDADRLRRLHRLVTEAAAADGDAAAAGEAAGADGPTGEEVRAVAADAARRELFLKVRAGASPKGREAAWRPRAPGALAIHWVHCMALGFI